MHGIVIDLFEWNVYYPDDNIIGVERHSLGEKGVLFCMHSAGCVEIQYIAYLFHVCVLGKTCDQL
jgi:hypothetical protein